MKKFTGIFIAAGLILCALLVFASCSKVDPNYSKQLLYTELTENHVTSEGYTAASYSKYNEAYLAARAVYEQSDSSAVDADRVREELINARKALVKTADFSQLKLALDEYATYSEKQYTSESFAAYRASYEAALAVYGKDTSKQSEINASVTAMMQARNALEKLPDTTSLEKLLQTHLSAGDYTTASFAQYEEAYNAAKALVESGTASKVELMGAEKRLTEATRALVFKGDMSSLQRTYESIRAQYLGVSPEGRSAEVRYTKYSFRKLSAAMSNAQELLSGNDASQEDISSAVSEMSAAVTELVDLSPLLDRIDMLQDYEAQSDFYTDESYMRLLSAMNEGMNLVASGEAVTAEEIAAAGTLIDSAAAALERKGLTADGLKNKSLSVKVITVGNAGISLQDYLEDFGAFFNDALNSDPSLAFYNDGDNVCLVSAKNKVKITLGDRYFRIDYSGGYPVSADDKAAASFAGINVSSSEFDVSSDEKLGAPTEFVKRTEIEFGKEKVLDVLTYENEAKGIRVDIEYNATNNYITYIEISAAGTEPEPPTPVEPTVTPTPAVGP